MSLPPAYQPFPDQDEDGRRKAEIEEMMRWQRERYFRDEPVQQEYRDILDRMADRQAEAEQAARPPGPFDLKLAEFLQKRAGEGTNADAGANRWPQVTALDGLAGVTLPDDGVGDTEDRYSKAGILNHAARALQPYRVAQVDAPARNANPRVYPSDTSWMFDGGAAEAGSIFRRDDQVPNRAAKGDQLQVNRPWPDVPDAGVGKGDRLPVANPARSAAPTRSSAPSAAGQPSLAPSPAPGVSLSGDPAQLFDQRFRGTPLEGQWNTVRNAAQRSGIPPTLAAAVMAHETGNGANVRGNNPAGLMDPKTKWMTKQQFPTIEAGINASIANLARRYREAGGDLGRLADIYAPQGAANDRNNLNKHWYSGVERQLKYYDNFTAVY